MGGFGCSPVAQQGAHARPKHGLVPFDISRLLAGRWGIFPSRWRVACAGMCGLHGGACAVRCVRRPGGIPMAPPRPGRPPGLPPCGLQPWAPAVGPCTWAGAAHQAASARPARGAPRCGGRTHTAPQAHVRRVGPLCKILGPVPGPPRPLGRPIGPLGCQRAPVGSRAIAPEQPKQWPKLHRKSWPVHWATFQKRDCNVSWRFECTRSFCFGRFFRSCFRL